MTLLAALLLPAAARGADSAAQVAWELSPYRVEVLIAIDSRAGLSRGETAELLDQLTSRAENVAGGGWKLTVRPAPASLRSALLADLAALPAEALPAASLSGDKVLVVGVKPALAGIAVQVREYDATARAWNGLRTREVGQPENLPQVVLDALFAAFGPQGRIETVEGNTATVRLRAGALGRRDGALPLLADGVVFRPLLVTSDASGAAAGPPQAIPWTYLVPTGVRGSLVTCRIESGLAGPPLPEFHPSQLRLALASQGGQGSTKLKLVSQGTGAPLAGYEVVALPGTGETKPQPLGRSDRQGIVAIPSGTEGVRIVVLRQGDEILARVPIAPGLASELTLPLPDASQRLAVETALAEIADGLVDLAARREALAARVRIAVAKSDVEPALKLVQQLRDLPAADPWLTRLDQAQPLLAAVDAASRKRLEGRIADLRQLAETLIADKPVERLEAELKAASAGK
ncbi:MAG: hypothetical protein SFU86_12685 [Pirellulaceae bacterium]|nr:hypothetical protein [Pirellulaceae bacterium]